MSRKAFLLIQTEVGKADKVIATLKEIAGVRTADRVTGPYDVICVVEGERLDEVGSVVTGKIQRVPGISRIVTCWALKED